MDFRADIIIDALPLLLEGLGATLKLCLLSFLLALAAGILVGVLRSKSLFFQRLFAPYVEIFRGTPLLIQLFFIYYGLPSVGITMDNYTAGTLGLGLNGGAYISEIIRGALFSVNQGQEEAAKALGLNWFQSMVFVILPQAVRVALPPLVNAFSTIIKESSLVSVLAITELTRASQLVYTRTFRAFEIYLTVGLLYFIIIYSASLVSTRLEKRLNRFQ
ncbi:MAG: amino acid ABC transporter permease [Desulfobacterium sp.]|nr:amino acid ABC transporter permease [Desulfobacterium sp.]